MKLRRNYWKTAAIPIMIGIFIGILMMSDLQIRKILSFLTSDIQTLDIFPFEVPLIIFFFLLVIPVLILNVNRMNVLLIEKREKIFIVLMIVGLHTSGLLPGKMDTSDLLFGAFTVWWLVNAFVNKSYRIISGPLNFLNLALFMCAILSMINGGLSVIFRMLPMVKAMVICFFIIDILRKKEWVVFFIKTLLVVTTISAITGIVQEIIFLLNGTIAFSVDPKLLKFLFEPTPFGTFLRVPAYTGLHLFLANYIVISLLLGLNAFLYLRDRLTQREKLFLKVAMMIMSVALILTFSKTNMLGLTAGFTLSILIKWPQKMIHFSMILLLVVVGSYYVPGLWDTVYNHIVSDMELGGDMGLRVQLMRRGVEGFLYRYPLLGAGVGRGTEYTQDVFGWGTHNAFILAADDVGIFGFFVFLSLFVYAFIRIITTIPVTRNLDEKTILKALLTGFIAYTVNIQFQPDFLSYYTWIFLGLMEGATGLFRKMHLGAA
jgi:hypothetical protein